MSRPKPNRELVGYLERKLEKLPTINISQIWDTLNDYLENILSEIIQNLVSSMLQRIEAVIKARGGHTKY